MNITSLRDKLACLINPFVKLMILSGLSPNQITYLSFLFGTAAAACCFAQSFVIAAVFLILSGLFDLADGSVARATNKKSDFGAVIDWIVDKYVDGIVLLAVGLSGISIISWFTGLPPVADMAVAGAAVIGSIMNTFIKPVTYAEIGYTCKADGKISDPLEGVGFFGRPETMIVLILGGLFGFIWLSMIVIAVCTNLSALQRIVYLWKKHGKYKT